MKRVLHISKFYYPFVGGIEQTARDCVLALKGNYEQKVIAFNEEAIDAIDIVDGIEVMRCNCLIKISSQPISTSYKKRLCDLILEFEPDIIIFHYPNPLVASYLLKCIRRNIKIRLVLYWHLDIIKQKFLRLFFYKQNIDLISRANVIISTSPNYIEGSRWLRKAKSKCIVIPSCINLERMKINENIKIKAKEIRNNNKNKTICVAVGRHTKYKGFDYLIKASKYLDNSFRIFITGKGELTNKLYDLAQGNDVIKFCGQVSDEELKALLLAADIFCFPSISKNEAFGLALAEAMYYKKPAVTFNIKGSGVNYVCINGEDGIEVENGNVKEYAEAIKKLSTDKNLRVLYGENGKKRVIENFTGIQFNSNIQNLIKSISREIDNK